MKADASAASTPGAAKLVAQRMMYPTASTSIPEMTPSDSVRTIRRSPMRLR